MAQPLGNILLDLLRSEPFTLGVQSADYQHDTLRAEVKERDWLKVSRRVLKQEDHYLALWREKALIWLTGIVDALPVAALCDPYPDGSTELTPVISAYAPLHNLIDDFPVLLSRTCCTFLDADMEEAGLFAAFRDQMERTLCDASGIAWRERFSSKRPFVLPYDKKGLGHAALTDLYTGNTILRGLFALPIPLSVPDEVRFEHTHIVGGTGHGKTQLLQYLIARDLHNALDQDLSLVVIDPDGTLIKTITSTDYFGPYLLAERCIFIDPSDLQYPVSLNLFDVSHASVGDARTRETIENNITELFEYFFDALLGSELTGKQSTLFRYLGLLLMRIPEGNIHTLRKLCEDAKPYQQYIDKLPDTARTFFETRFNSRDMQATKTQVLNRLWGVLSNRSLDRVLSGTHNSVNFDEALQSGKLIFIHTSNEHLGEEGSAIFARMMVALLGQALIRRAAIAPELRTDTYIYIDEAEGVVDATLVRLLAQARKYRGALTIVHQHLDQLSTSARAGIFANTSIKLAGGVSAKDANSLSSEMRTTPDFILSNRKDKDVSRFALFAKNYTETAMTLSVPLGYMEGIERLSGDDYVDLLNLSRERYGQGVDTVPVVVEVMPPAPLPIIQPDIIPEIEDAPHTPLPPKIHHKEGGGGVRHKAICHSIKELGEGAGYRASVEEVILDGAGRVDLVLRDSDRTIAFEISVTTSKEHELMNVRKCLSAGFTEIVMVAQLPRHLLSLERYITGKLSESERNHVRFMSPDDAGSLFEGGEKVEKVVRGWRVESRSNGVIPNSIRKSVAKAIRD